MADVSTKVKAGSSCRSKVATAVWFVAKEAGQRILNPKKHKIAQYFHRARQHEQGDICTHAWKLMFNLRHIDNKYPKLDRKKLASRA